jgi:hypothetical protein
MTNKIVPSEKIVYWRVGQRIFEIAAHRGAVEYIIRVLIM